MRVLSAAECLRTVISIPEYYVVLEGADRFLVGASYWAIRRFTMPAPHLDSSDKSVLVSSLRTSSGVHELL